MNQKMIKKYSKLITIVAILLLIGVIAATISARVISQKPMQDNFEKDTLNEEAEADSNELNEPDTRPCEQLRQRDRDCNSNCNPQDCQYRKRTCGC